MKRLVASLVTLAVLAFAGTAGATCTKQTALTFDDGPWGDNITTNVVDRLDQFGIKGTFFQVGRQFDWFPGLSRYAVTHGHLIENHTFTHPDMTTLTTAQMTSELSQTNAKIMGEGAPKPTLWRPPANAHNATTDSIASQMGMSLARWGVDSQDWGPHSSDTPAQFTNWIKSQIYDGSIILMHNGWNQFTAGNALPTLIPTLRDAGYCFATLAPSATKNMVGGVQGLPADGQGFVRLVNPREATGGTPQPPPPGPYIPKVNDRVKLVKDDWYHKYANQTGTVTAVDNSDSTAGVLMDSDHTTQWFPWDFLAKQ